MSKSRLDLIFSISRYFDEMERVQCVLIEEEQEMVQPRELCFCVNTKDSKATWIDLILPAMKVGKVSFRSPLDKVTKALFDIVLWKVQQTLNAFKRRESIQPQS